MSKWIRHIAFALTVGAITWSLAGAPSVMAQEAAPAAEPAPAAAAPAEATVEQRVADLEMYFQNLGVGGSGDTTWASKIAGVPGPGHNAWLMIASALVLFMTLPGLALFYGGLVRQKNILSVMAQCLGITAIVVTLWWAVGYSLVFGKGFDSAFIGGLEKLFMTGVTSAPNTDYCYWVSENVFSMFQLMFAIITPALIVGAIAERMKFAAISLFVVLWMLAVYFPLAHMVWGVNGFMNGVWNSASVIPAMDFAGGTVVHMSSGWSALVLCIMLGKRLGFGKESMAPHSMVLCMVGTGMLWVGWYGFNAGSALAADGIASNAFTTTTIAAALAAGAWALCEVVTRGKASVLGFCSGAVAGLVVVTPACGFITPQSAAIVGLLAGVVPFIFCTFVKKAAGYDDALDTFGIHAVGGTLGALLTGVFANSSVNANLTEVNTLASPKLVEAVKAGSAWVIQLQAIGLTIVLSIVATVVIALIVKVIFGLRVTEEVEVAGLDVAEHGEEGYTH
jgi:ammonium transporter, Amt family